jgi:hypothetical protein
MIVTKKEKALWYELWTAPNCTSPCIIWTYDVRVDLPQYAWIIKILQTCFEHNDPISVISNRLGAWNWHRKFSWTKHKVNQNTLLPPYITLMLNTWYGSTLKDHSLSVNHIMQMESPAHTKEINCAKLNECRAYSNFIMGISSSHFTWNLSLEQVKFTHNFNSLITHTASVMPPWCNGLCPVCVLQPIQHIHNIHINTNVAQGG